MLPPFTLYLAAGAALAGFCGGWAVRDHFADASALRAANRLMEEKDRMTGIIARHAGDFEAYRQSLEPARSQARTIIEREYRNVPVPADCAIRPDTLGLLESARQRANAAATGQPVEPVPDGTGDSAARPGAVGMGG